MPRRERRTLPARPLLAVALACVGVAASVGTGSGAFGACLASVSGAGASTWATGGCTQADGAWWNDVPAVPETVATAPTGDDSIVASMHFGVRVPATQAKGAYVAPLAVEVVAPAA